MSLHNSIDTVSFVSAGLYSETYETGAEINSLFASLGMLETAPSPSLSEIFVKIIGSSFKKLID